MTPVTLITRSKGRRSGLERSSISIGGATSSQRCNEEGIESHCTVRRKRLRTTTEIVGFVKDREIIADNLSKAGWSWGCVSVLDAQGRTIWIADAHRGDGKRFVVRANEMLTAFLEP
jgi:hypothetical protein